MTSKASHYRRHARQRAFQRFGTNLSDSDLRRLEKRIRNGEGIQLEKQTNTRSKIAIDLDGQTVPVIYSKSQNAIVTVLPEEALHD